MTIMTLSRKPAAVERELAAGFLEKMPFKSFAQALLSANEFN